MVISNKDRLPPVIIKGKQRPEMGEPRPQAGMIFYNDEGTENGGLIFSGSKNDKGQIVDSGALWLDVVGSMPIKPCGQVRDRGQKGIPCA
jgi:hypothetical protein